MSTSTNAAVPFNTRHLGTVIDELLYYSPHLVEWALEAYKKNKENHQPLCLVRYTLTSEDGQNIIHIGYGLIETGYIERNPAEFNLDNHFPLV